MKEKALLKQILDDYPRFFTKDPTSNHVKYHTVVASEFLQLKQQQYIVELAKNISRPLKLWREQNVPNLYSINYEVNLPDIKRVQLFQEGITTPLQDSGILQKGSGIFVNDIETAPVSINIFTDSLDNITSDTTIPSTRYYIVVEDYHENLLSKGIPENDTVLGDIYDHDSALDIIGANINTLRRNYSNSDDIGETDYQNTYPQYFLDKTEADYWYEERLKIEANTYGKLPLPSTEIFKYLGVYPSNDLNPDYPVGRWRQVCRMGTGNPDDQACGDVMGTLSGDIPTDGCKRMQSPEWNSAVFDVWIDPTMIPINIAYSEPTEDVLQSIINRTFPLSKRAYLQYNLSESMVDTTSVSDTIIGITGIGFENENINITENFKLTSTFPIGDDNISINENINVTINGSFMSTSTDGLVTINVFNPKLLTRLGKFAFGNLSTNNIVNIWCERYFY
jgi:hypothetical protein